MPFGGAMIDRDGRAGYICERSQALLESTDVIGGRRQAEHDDARHAGKPLRLGCARRRERPGQRGQQEAAAVHYSMT
jgi:hypothetical protein